LTKDIDTSNNDFWLYRYLMIQCIKLVLNTFASQVEEFLQKKIEGNLEKLNFTLKPHSIGISGFLGNIEQGFEIANSRHIILKAKTNHGR